MYYAALTMEIFLVGARGFEPPTPWTPSKCATRLRYAPTNVVYNSLVITCQLVNQGSGIRVQGSGFRD